MKILFLTLAIFTSSFSYGQKCEDLIRKLDPKASINPPVIAVNKMRFQFITPGINPTSTCSVKVMNTATNRSFTFMDDGSFLVMDDLKPNDPSGRHMRAQSYMLLPQEKGKNFGASRDGNIVSIRMNAGEFMFDTASGKMIPSPSLNVQETSTGVQFTEPKALLVEFGTLVGKNPKEAAGVTTVLRTGKSTCQFNKTDLLDSTYDRNIKVRTQSAQIEFFRKACVGTPISFTAQAEPSAPVRAPKPSRIGVDFLTKDQEDFDLPTDFGQSKGSQ